MRDYQLLWVLSIGFELMELTFQHMLPNFNECWWDSWILDVAVCNFLGMWAGMKVHICADCSCACALVLYLEGRCDPYADCSSTSGPAADRAMCMLLLLCANISIFTAPSIHVLIISFVPSDCRRWSGPRRRTTTGAG